MAQWDRTARFWIRILAPSPTQVVLDRSAPVQFCPHPLPLADDTNATDCAVPIGAYFPGLRATGTDPDPVAD